MYKLTQDPNECPAIQIEDQEMQWIVTAVGACAALPPSNSPEDIARHEEWKKLSEKLETFFSQTHGPKEPIMNEMYRRKHKGLSPVTGDKYDVPNVGIYTYDGRNWMLAQ
jgi:hypothetical protein